MRSVLMLAASLIAASALAQPIPTGSGWRINTGPEYPGAQGSVTHTGTGVRLSYDLACGSPRITGLRPSGCGAYVAAARTLSPALPLPDAAPYLRLSVRHPDPGLTGISLRVIDGTGQTLQYKGIVTRWPGSAEGGLQRIVYRLGRAHGFWGGANNGTPQTAIREVQIVAGAGTFNAPAGTLDIEGVSLSASADAPYALAADAPVPSALTLPQTQLAVAATHLDASRAAKLAAAGVSVVRMDMLWDHVEPTAGVFWFDRHRQAVDVAEAHGLRVLWILAYGSRHYGGLARPVSAADRAAFARYAARAATEFKGRRGVLGWEVWNEPNWFGYKDDPTAWALLAGEAVAAIRAADPGATVVSGGLSWVDYGYLHRLLQTGVLAQFDAIGMHPYRHGTRPETYAADVMPLANLLRSFGVAAPVWGTEWGQSLAGITGYGNGHSAGFRNRQAILNLRAVLTQYAVQAPLATVYSLQDRGTDPNNSEDNYGLLDANGNDKPAIAALRTLHQQTRGLAFRGAVPGTPAGLHVLRWDAAAHSVYAVWVDGSGVTITLTAPTGSTAVRWDGATQPASQALTEAAGVLFVRVPR